MGASMSSSMFMGYGSKPELTRETLHSASRLLNDTGLVTVVSWEDLKIAGRVIIGRVLDEIERADVCAMDLSTLNENVLFELGYGIAMAKPVWILLDRTDTAARAQWREFQLLKGVGFTGWANSEDIRNRFIAERPDLQPANLYDDLIEPELEVSVSGSIFYVQTYHSTDAARAIARRLDHEVHRGVRLLSADPTESSLNPLQWYAAKAYATECTLIHFESPRREDAAIHNQRAALVAGMARGLGRPVLMLAADDYSVPLDYDDLLKVYGSARECELIVDSWLKEQHLTPLSGARTPRIKLATELRALRFGEHVAENERDNLSEYFVETASFDNVISSRNTLFVGRKGTGKTASMYQAAARLSEDVRNLVVVIKPASYEFSSLLSLLSSLPVSMQQYSIEALWKFLLTSEIANRVVETVESRARGIPFTDAENQLLTFVQSNDFGLRGDFGTRFERTVNSLSELGLPDATESAGRDLLNEALHTNAIARLRSLLGPVLRSRRRVAVLIDNLDKGWEKHSDLDLLSKLLLGLLSAIGRVDVDFSKEDYWREKISLTVSTFLRSDIYDYMSSVAREPDKIPASFVTWDDPKILVRVVEERFLAVREEGTEPQELWDQFFCSTVNGTPTRDYILSRCLARPRDIIYWCNAAIMYAADRGNQRVEETDVLTAEVTYSQFAFEALLVENGITINDFKKVLFEFLGEPAVIPESRVRRLISAAGIAEDAVEYVVTRLVRVSFMGVETAADEFQYPDGANGLERISVLERKFRDASGATEPRFSVHPAYRAYLELEE